MQFNATLYLNQHYLSLPVLVDSGADENFSDEMLAAQSSITAELLDLPLDTSALEGRLLACVTQQTEPRYLNLSGNHHEKICNRSYS